MIISNGRSVSSAARRLLFLVGWCGLTGAGLLLVVRFGTGHAAAQPAGALDDAAALCQRAVGRAGLKFKKLKLTAWRKCLDGRLTGKGCNAASRDTAIAAAEAQYVEAVARRCRTPQLLFDPPPGGVGFPQSCDLEPGPLEAAEAACRALPVGNATELTRCLICWKQAELHELVKILYPCLADQVPAGSDLDCGTPPPTCPADAAGVKCTRTIVKSSIKLFLSREKYVERCLDNVSLGKIQGPCPDAGAQAKIADLEERTAELQGRCAQTPPWWDVCPEDSEPPCDQTISSVADITRCIERSTHEIADELVCLQYPGAAAHGLPCPLPEPCGNGVVEPGEQCDPPGSLCASGQPCNADCTCRCDTDGDCTDNDACNGVERCVAQRCTPGLSPNCDDHNPCTTDGCDSSTGCTHINNTDPCDDGNHCTTNDRCSGAACAGGPSLDCDDHDPCTTDSCDTALGCQNPPTRPAPLGCACTSDSDCDNGRPCDGQETCPAGTCQAGLAPTCHEVPDNPCTTDSCDPSNGCQHQLIAGCRPCTSNGDCDNGDVCDGAETCVFSPPGNPVGTCQSGMPPNCNDGNPCTTDSCDPVLGCQNPAGNAGTECRPLAGVCDVAETCTGTSTACPPDAKKPAGTVCRTAADICDLAETCDGVSNGCPPDSLAPSSTPCRAAAGECDLAENCTGTSTACPPNAFKPNGTACSSDGNVCTADVCNGAGSCTHPAGNAGALCRGAAGPCDIAETCTGSSTTCPADAFYSSTTLCRGTGGNECDVPEYCPGNGPNCPADGFQPYSTTCSNDGSTCTLDWCNGTGACIHPRLVPSTSYVPVDMPGQGSYSATDALACCQPYQAGDSNCGTDWNYGHLCQQGNCDGAPGYVIWQVQFASPYPMISGVYLVPSHSGYFRHEILTQSVGGSFVTRATVCNVNMVANASSGTDGNGRYNVPFGVNVSNVQYLQVRTSPCTNCGQPSSACSSTNVAWYEVEPYRLGP